MGTMGQILSVIGIILIAPFALVAAFAAIALIWVLLMFSIKVVFAVGGALFVVVFIFWMLAMMVEGFNSGQTSTTRPSGRD
jgi:hypothetical protein